MDSNLPRCQRSWPPSAVAAVQAIVERGPVASFFAGPEVRSYEAEFSATFGGRPAIALNSGTAALHCAYAALGIDAGDEVIMPANAYISAATAALQLNAIPVFCDVSLDTGVMDAAAVEAVITRRTKAIVVVHLYGYPVAMQELSDLAEARGLLIIEDCAQAHGATVNGAPVGTLGDAGCFSSTGQKLVYTGEGGMLLLGPKMDPALVRRLVYKGKEFDWRDYRHMGYSYALTDLQAALGRISLAGLPDELARRRGAADEMISALASFTETEARPLHPVDETRPCFYRMPVYFPRLTSGKLNSLAELLVRDGVDAQFGYPCLPEIQWIRNKEYSAWQVTQTGREVCYDVTQVPNARRLAHHVLSFATGPNAPPGLGAATVPALEAALKALSCEASTVAYQARSGESV